MKKLIIGLSIILCGLLMVGTMFSSNILFAFATNNSDSNENITELFGDKEIQSAEYLYNYDDSADYIYINFFDYGYAIYFAKTLEVMEYAPSGSLPYPNTAEKKYYFGPMSYFALRFRPNAKTLTLISVGLI